MYNTVVQSVFPSISEVVGHIYLMDTTWLGVIRNDSFQEIVGVITLPESHQEQKHRGYGSYVSQYD